MPDEYDARRELALAILLWRAMRADFGRTHGDLGAAVEAGLVVTEAAERLADLAGCRAEFYALMAELPVLNVRVENLDGGGKAKPVPKKERRAVRKWRGGSSG